MAKTSAADDTTGEPLSGRRLSRRSLLLGTAGGVIAAGMGAGAAVDEGLLPGRSTLHRLLHLQGRPGAIPDVTPGQMISGTFTSQARAGASCGYSISYPPGAATKLPVLVVLHGRGGDHTQAFGNHLGLDRFLAQTVGLVHVRSRSRAWTEAITATGTGARPAMTRAPW
jgi:hypothetical protein